MKSPTPAMLASARASVLGVITARVGDNIDGASMVIDTYLRESVKAGYSLSEAWAQLFAASVLLTLPLLECRATHHEQPMDVTLSELGLILAQTGHGHG